MIGPSIAQACRDQPAAVGKDHQRSVFKTILVACDGTGPGNAALHQGVELARLCHAAVHVLGIVETLGGMLMEPASMGLDLVDIGRTALHAALSDALSAHGAIGASAIVAVRDGEARREIITYAQEIGADLVVMGHGEKGFLERLFEGSVSAGLLAEMPCSLLFTAPHLHGPPAA